MLDETRKLNKENKLAMKTKVKKVAVADDGFPKYFLSNNAYSYYLYGDDDAVAYCFKDNNPKFWNGKRWKEATSFTEFCDKAVEISLPEFKRQVLEQRAEFEPEGELK